MNKKIFLLFSTAIILSVQASAQITNPVKKLYAYKQAGIPGIRPDVNRENGATQKPELKESFNYWFYLVLQKSENINITAIWLSGKKFTVKTEPIKELPVKIINHTSGPGSDTAALVPFTKDAVLLTYPTGKATAPMAISKYFSSLIKAYELVIVYYWKGKKFYKVSGKIKVLEPEARM
jgi:hypothetical protein